VKLPRWFKIDTPIGDYNPDWAFVTEREEKLYFAGRPRAHSTARSAARRKTRKSTASLAEVKF
jgi:type III restriction enzyme